jgi:hypothetical protein
MPNEFKIKNGLVVEQGSSQITGSLTVSGSTTITGSLSQGAGTTVSGLFSHAEGDTTQAVGYASHAEGGSTIASGSYSHAEGNTAIASGSHSHAEGSTTQAIGEASHAEGEGTLADGNFSHAEGSGTISAGTYSHAEGANSQAIGNFSHAEGNTTIASGSHSHAEGSTTTALGQSSHAEGRGTQAIGDYSHAEGLSTTASGSYQHVQGQYNIASSAQSAFIVGNGVDDNNRSNLIFASDNTIQITGSLRVSGSITGSLFGTSSWATNAITASYALNGGVTQLLAGPNITLAPTNGLGQVTISSTAGGGSSFNTATGSYGSFYDTTLQTNPVANIPRSMSLNTTDITNGVSISGSTNPFNTYIKTQNAGVYNIQFSAQVEKTDSGTDEIVIWLRKNGIDLTDTATTITLVGNSTKVVAAWNWFVTSAANDYYQIIWISADTGMRLLAETISGTHPGIPSVIVTANRVDQFLSNTGSFSGSFTGTLAGTASFASTASFAPSYLPITTPTATGLVISFTQDRVYGTFASPETGSAITSDTGSAILGVTNLIIHSASSAPTTGSDFKKLTGSSDYVAGLNYIYCTYIADNQIIYSISQAT